MASTAKTLFASNRLWGSRLPIAAIRYSFPVMRLRARAELVLNTLYHQLERGGQIGGGDVDGAVRLSLGGAPADDVADRPRRLDKLDSLRTNRREVVAR